MLLCVGDGDCRYQGDALVCRAEQHIELQAGMFDGAQVERSQLPDAAAVVKQSAIEKIRTGAAGFEGKFAELQYLVADCEVDEFGLIVSHRGAVMDFAGPGAAARALARRAVCSIWCATSGKPAAHTRAVTGQRRH